MKRNSEPLSASTIQAAWHSYRQNVGVSDAHKAAFIAGAVWALGKMTFLANEMQQSSIKFLPEPKKQKPKQKKITLTKEEYEGLGFGPQCGGVLLGGIVDKPKVS